jgi:hypothetical protein
MCFIAIVRKFLLKIEITSIIDPFAFRNSYIAITGMKMHDDAAISQPNMLAHAGYSYFPSVLSILSGT